MKISALTREGVVFVWDGQVLTTINENNIFSDRSVSAVRFELGRKPTVIHSWGTDQREANPPYTVSDIVTEGL